MGRMRGASAGSLLRGIAMAAWLLFCVFLPGVAGAQDKPLTAYFRETWTTRQGLPHNQVNAIAQTPDGYLWFGTWEGLARYNGLEFHVFDRGNTPALKDNGVRSVRASEDGALVIGTSRGGVTVKRGDSWRAWPRKKSWTRCSTARDGCGSPPRIPASTWSMAAGSSTTAPAAACPTT